MTTHPSAAGPAATVYSADGPELDLRRWAAADHLAVGERAAAVRAGAAARSVHSGVDVSLSGARVRTREELQIASGQALVRAAADPPRPGTTP